MDRHIEWTSQFTSSNKFSPAPLKVVEVLEQGILLGPFYVAGTEEELDRAVEATPCQVNQKGVVQHDGSPLRPGDVLFNRGEHSF